ncbi:hypothetical protein [Bacillus phage vB_BsuS_PJN02]|uniref:Uncharacterized protein n=1 Tax=Bacillus phage vB_BsuS_PJN02 TaxID=2920374 RepID=A0AC61TRM1_9CAUD|nr:hypothetical protein PQE76_gp001 [Bacillus phage vB_BsuS_PJN02]UNH58344.1 hypothetical protein [Bacillus phage vB_BsuS_PJN02]
MSVEVFFRCHGMLSIESVYTCEKVAILEGKAGLMEENGY